jgi:hypothetical protein
MMGAVPARFFSPVRIKSNRFGADLAHLIVREKADPDASFPGYRRLWVFSCREVQSLAFVFAGIAFSPFKAEPAGGSPQDGIIRQGPDPRLPRSPALEMT